jgi:hypothetical protein
METVQGRCARSVCIVTDLPITVQPKNKIKGKPSILRLGSVKLKITETGSGELVIEIEPP